MVFSSSAILVNTKYEDPACAHMLNALNTEDGNPLKQLSLIDMAEDELCFKGSGSELAGRLNNKLLHAEADILYRIAVKLDEIAEFDVRQRERVSTTSTAN